ncbi:hypothetical protein MNBD_BACTEROID05-229, partial [hydrothermal vent metagenome]
DALYQTSEFLEDKNLTIEGKLTTSLENLSYQGEALTYRFSIDYPNDLIDNFMACIILK